MTGKIFWCALPPQEGEALLAQSHPQAGEASQRLQALRAHWEKLRQVVALRDQDLADRQSFLEFLQRADLCEAWTQEMVRPRLGRAWGEPQPLGAGCPKTGARSTTPQPPAPTGGDREHGGPGTEPRALSAAPQTAPGLPRGLDRDKGPGRGGRRRIPAPLHWEIQFIEVAECGLWSQVRAQVTAPHFPPVNA